MNFVTAGDSGFSKPLQWSVGQISLHHPDASMYIYDWGLAEPDRHSLQQYEQVNLIDWQSEMDYNVGLDESIRLRLEESLKENKYTNFVLRNQLNYEYHAVSRRNEYLYSQKPHCIRDCATRIDGDLVFLDGDAVLANDIDEVMNDDFDIGVTLRPQKEIEAARERGNFHVLNAGVIYFPCPAKKITAFVNEWISRMSELECDLYEQTALTQLVQTADIDIYDDYYNTGTLNIDGFDITVKVLPTAKYNYYKIEDGVNPNDNRVLHFKNKRFEMHELDNVLQ